MTSEIKKRIADIRAGKTPEGYKKTKVGIVPVEWDRFKLSDISEELTEKAGDNVYETLSISAGIGFVNQADKFGKELSGKQYEKYIVLHKGDFSYNKGNSKKYPQGCIYQLKDREAAAVPNVFESFRLTKGINDYYEQLFVSGFMNGQLFAKINHGVRDDGLLNLKGDDFYSCYVPSPPLPEQQKIAEILSTQDKLIELQEKKIEKLKERKKAYLQKMFPKKGSKYPELRFNGFTDAWEEKKFGDLANYKKGPFGSALKKEIFVPRSESTVKVYEQQNAINKDWTLDRYHITKEYAEKLSGFQVNGGDIIVSCAGTIGELYELPENAESGIINQALMKIVVDEIIVDKKLFEILFTNMIEEFTRVHSNGSAIKNIPPFSDLKPMEVLIPTKEEQIKISTFFNNIEKHIILNQRKLEQEKQKKKALMQLLLTGIVRTK